MNQHEIQRLKAELGRNEREKRELEKRLSKAQSYTSPTTPGFQPVAGSYPAPASSRFSPHDKERSRIRAISRGTTASHGTQLRDAQQVSRSRGNAPDAYSPNYRIQVVP